MNKRRVVVTGLGLVSPLGVGVNNCWERLVNSKSGIKNIDHFNVSDLPCKIAGIIPSGTAQNGGLDLDEWINQKNQRKLDRFIMLGLIAAQEAVEDSGLFDLSDNEKNRIGVMVGSGIGGLQTIAETTLILEEKGPRRISPFFIPSSLINLISGQISIKYGFKGPNHSVVTACATGSHAIGDAAKLISSNNADVMIAGGSEAAICRLGIAGFSAARALSTSFNDNPEEASRPWDVDRDGFVMGEGAGVLVLEELSFALKRNKKIYAEVLGYGLSGDAYHITAPESSGDGAYRAMKQAVNDSGILPKEIGYINAHGTSTPLGDLIELEAVRRLMNGEINNLCMSSTKSSIGHLLGAAGAVESIFSILSIKQGLIPPTLNLDKPAKEASDFNLVPAKSQNKKIEYAMSNSFGFGGTNASLIFGKLK